MRRGSQRYFADSQLDPRLRAGLVGHWIGGGSGLTWFDRSGNGNHGALTDGPSWTLGEGGKRNALAFNGSYVEVPANTAHDITSSGWSLASWVNLSDISAFHSIAGKWSGGIGWYVTISTAGLVDFGYAADYYGNKALTPGRWHHVACTHDGGSDLRIYVDGVLDRTAVRTLIAASANHLNVGRVTGGTYYMAGVIDDVRIYNRALAASEIALLAQPAFLPVVPRRWYLSPNPNVTAPQSHQGVSLALPTGALASALVSSVAPTAPMGVSLALPTAALSPWFMIISVTAPTPSIGVSLSHRTARLFQWRLSPDVVHNLSAAMRTAAAAAIAPFIEVCEVDFPAATLRFAQLPYASLERGHFADKVQSFGPTVVTPSDRSGALGAPETTMTLDDTDRQLAMITEGEDANNLVGSAVRRYLAHPDVAFADWHLLFEGVITKEPEFPSEGRSTVLTARVDDAPLELKAPRQGWTIDRTSWPNAHPDAITKSAPMVYGPHDSSNFQTSPGFLPGLLVDTLANKYAFAAGRLEALDTIFVDDVLTASGWTMSYATCRRGRVWTIVTFTTSQGDAKITANGTGYEATGNGAGALITDSADQLAHLLSNFYFTDWARGSTWNATSSRIGTSLTSATGVVKTFLANRVPSASPYYGAPVTGADVVREFCDNHGLRAFWYAGKLEFAVEDVAVEPYNGHAIDGDQETISLGIGRDDIAVSPEVRVDHVPSAESGGFLSSFGVQLPDAAGDETDNLALRWSDAS